MSALNTFFETYPWGIYAILVLGPFIQEDAAVIGGASAAAAGMGEAGLLLSSVLIGLSLSDIWKYWAGRAAIGHSWAKKIAARPGVCAARDRVHDKLAISLVVVRFVPGTRIPFYLASGFFKAPFWRFAIFLVLSGALYIGLMYGLFHAFGQVAGEQLKGWLPIAAIAIFVSILLVQKLVRGRMNKAGA